MEGYKVEKCWFHKDLKCVVVALEVGHRCGYVAVPEGHPLYKKHELDEALSYIKVHGGITFSEGANVYPINCKDVWWFGFDCARGEDGKDWSIMSEDYKNYHRKYRVASIKTIVRDLDFCVKECNSLAEQLAMASNKEILLFEEEPKVYKKTYEEVAVLDGIFQGNVMVEIDGKVKKASGLVVKFVLSPEE